MSKDMVSLVFFNSPEHWPLAHLTNIDQDVHLWRVLYDLLGFFIPVVIIIQLLTGKLTLLLSETYG